MKIFRVWENVRKWKEMILSRESRNIRRVEEQYVALWNMSSSVTSSEGQPTERMQEEWVKDGKCIDY